MKTFKKLLPYILLFAFMAIFLYAQEALKVNSSGNVGIGIAPTSKLEVAGRIKDATGFVAPVGTIVAYGGASAPIGWLMCDGASYSRTGTYADLYGVIQTVFGYTDGTHFDVPDMRGIFPKGAGTTTRAAGQYMSGYYYAGNLGEYKTDQLQGHYTTSYSRGNDNTGSEGMPTSGDGGGGGTRTYYNGIPYTDGANGTPRTGKTTEPQSLGVTYIIKY